MGQLAGCSPGHRYHARVGKCHIALHPRYDRAKSCEGAARDRQYDGITIGILQLKRADVAAQIGAREVALIGEEAGCRIAGVNGRGIGQKRVGQCAPAVIGQWVELRVCRQVSRVRGQPIPGIG